MVDTKTPGDKTLSVPTKTLTLKPRVETGTVRQSFSHGRTKQVVVEKRGKRRVGGDGPLTEAPAAPEPVVAKVAPVAKPPLTRPAPQPAAPRNNSGVVLRTLTEDERLARASALADAKVRDDEERRLAGSGSQAPQQQGRHRAGRTRGRRSPPQGRRRAPSARRGSQAQGRSRGQEAFWRSRSPRCRSDCARRRRAARGALPVSPPTQRRG